MPAPSAVNAAVIDVDASGSGTTPVEGSTDWQPLTVAPRDFTLAVSVDTLTGTSPKITGWLQGTCDHGTKVFDIAAATVLKTDSTTAGGTVSANQRNVVPGETSTSPTYHEARFVGITYDEVRFHYVLEGTDPVVALSVFGLPA